MDLQFRYPYLNLKENACDYLVRRVIRMQQLLTILDKVTNGTPEEEWDKMNHEVVNSLNMSMSRHCYSCESLRIHSTSI
ncbi:hypothetical protein NPIL_363221 [Nephila pilipes]|uniref:Uncharacterized protein n=1 Tax=Nephila pilipes TaxID=299642 RepID=A0A8X6Q2A5_NEPPI|nr:hypothetical protein NPIL_363221 [Nephila pilipes]